MSYDTRDQSQEDGNPILLFQFAQGSTTYRYALANELAPLTIAGNTWTPSIMLSSEFGQSNDVGKDELTLSMAANDPLAQTFSSGSPDAITTLTVFRTFTSPEETPVTYWKGRVASVGIEPGKIVMNCEPIWSHLQRPGLRFRYTKTCRHVLFGRGCNLSPVGFSNNYTITQSSGSLVTLPSSGFTSYKYWEGGVLEWLDSGVKRMIVKQEWDKVTLIRPIKAMNQYLVDHPSGTAVKLYRGCDHSYAMCKSRFNNAGNFGGDPFFAQKNPFTSQVTFI